MYVTNIQIKRIIIQIMYKYDEKYTNKLHLFVHYQYSHIMLNMIIRVHIIFLQTQIHIHKHIDFTLYKKTKHVCIYTFLLFFCVIQTTFVKMYYLYVHANICMCVQYLYISMQKPKKNHQKLTYLYIMCTISVHFLYRDYFICTLFVYT